MMDPAYFIGRKAIVDWINSTFQMNLGKIEETASGAVACQIVDAIFPGELPMAKVRWDCKVGRVAAAAESSAVLYVYVFPGINLQATGLIKWAGMVSIAEIE